MGILALLRIGGSPSMTIRTPPGRRHLPSSAMYPSQSTIWKGLYHQRIHEEAAEIGDVGENIYETTTDLTGTCALSTNGTIVLAWAKPAELTECGDGGRFWGTEKLTLLLIDLE